MEDRNNLQKFFNNVISQEDSVLAKRIAIPYPAVDATVSTGLAALSDETVGYKENLQLGDLIEGGIL